MSREPGIFRGLDRFSSAIDTPIQGSGEADFVEDGGVMDDEARDQRARRAQTGTDPAGPVDGQFILRGYSDPRDETKILC